MIVAPKYWKKRFNEIAAGISSGLSRTECWIMSDGICCAMPTPRPWMTWKPIQWLDGVWKVEKCVYSAAAVHMKRGPIYSQGL